MALLALRAVGQLGVAEEHPGLAHEAVERDRAAVARAPWL